MISLKVRRRSAVIVTRKRCRNHPSCAKGIAAAAGSQGIQTRWPQYSHQFPPTSVTLHHSHRKAFTALSNRVAVLRMTRPLFPNYKCVTWQNGLCCLPWSGILSLPAPCTYLCACACVGCFITMPTPHSIVFDPDRQTARADVSHQPCPVHPQHLGYDKPACLVSWRLRGGVGVREVSMNVCVCECRGKDKNIFRGNFVFFLVMLIVKFLGCFFLS